MGLKIGGSVEKVNGKELSYDEFVRRFMAKNEPLVVSGLMDDWRACKDWVLDDGRPNLHFFSSNFGNSRVQVADCRTREYTDQKRLEMSVSEFIDHWLDLSSESHDITSAHKLDERPLLYLKDWHFVKEYPDYSAYTTPLIFCDDWLNLYLDHYRMHEDPQPSEINEISCSDYRFVYMGPKGTWTPLHADVFRSYSWSANICGKKQWYLLSPDQRDFVFDRNLKISVYDILEDVSDKNFPGFKKAIWLECTQEQNEVIFVPSGWYHQVHNLEDTISVNHNWFNGYNLSCVWDLLLRDYNEAKDYIEDIKDLCDDFEGLCQRNLAANTGMNCCDFFVFIVHVSLANLVQLHRLPISNGSTIWSLSPRARHICFNLESARNIALKMKSSGLIAKQMDFRRKLEDPTFLELCTYLERTYATIHKQYKITCDMQKDMVNMSPRDLSKSLVCSAEDLINVIDHACAACQSSAISAEDSLW